MKKLLRSAVASSLLAVCFTSTSCIGPNNAYDGVKSWNSRLSDSKIVNELVFLCGYIIPVYPIILTGDLLIFNSVEFWFGKNWINKPQEFKPQETQK